uniref:LamG-like jellyroll fold domain-containing protein n=1 Tax=Roseovarius sp. TaxID=1486281 RepID=UPI0035698FE8
TAVATLTAAHDAQWAAFKPRAGDTLYAGQRFTLTEGFAEITTAGGAVAILEAPATIELTDNDNALRLHAGNLVGICETESSKGFLVRTPHMDITDLGTRFAIAVEPDAEHGEAQSASEVIVMDGKVRVQPSPEAGVAFEPVQLSASESVRCETSGRGLLPTKRAASDFYRSIPDAYEQYVRAQDPVGYWRFEEDRALSLISNLGHSGDRLTRIGRVEPDPRGAVGGSARFDGQSRVELSAPRGLDLTHSFTIASWVYLEPGDDGIQRVFSNGLLRNGKPKAGFGLGVDRLSTDRAYAFFTFYGIADYRSSTAALPTGRWVHLAVSVDRAGQPTFYIDGIAERHQLRSNPSEQNPPPSGRPSDADAWIADAQVGANSPGEAFQGRIDELVILPKPLSSEQIEWLAQRPGIQP